MHGILTVHLGEVCFNPGPFHLQVVLYEAALLTAVLVEDPLGHSTGDGSVLPDLRSASGG